MSLLPLRLPPDLEARFLADDGRRSLPHIRGVLLTGILAFAGFSLLDIWFLPSLSIAFAWIRLGLVCPLLLLLLGLTYRPGIHRWSQGIISAAITVAGIGVVFLRWAAPITPNFDEMHVGLLLVLMYAYTVSRLRFFFATLVGWGLIVVYQVTAAEIGFSATVLAKSSFLLTAISLIGMYASYAQEKSARKDFLQSQQILMEHQRAEDLLLNILPKAIAERLKQSPERIAESYLEATILFADIVNFTQLAEGLSPHDLVELLNSIFSDFDRLVDQLGLEKIKTIGDAYMVVGGIPVVRMDHAQAVADLALAMQQVIERYRLQGYPQMDIRIGINSGPVIAGVIGLKKFIYDLWGDTVNVASRMESQGQPGTIQISQSTFDILQSDYRCSLRGNIAIKGKGDMTTYFLHQALHHRCGTIP
ncbi:MAG: adenylate/guanylate cyclase domain-containing protein [Synechococcaceae cyanobacterium SM2_3_2]|nr:adenylate/guanylate cyclase domain-containing protein [Synechococcaceae cyanobacterium SM2_3_2]